MVLIANLQVGQWEKHLMNRMHFAGKTGLFIYICSCPFCDNSNVIDLVKVYKPWKNFPKHSNGDYVWCFVERFSYSPPGHTYERCIVFFKWIGKKQQIFYKFYVSKLWISMGKYLQSLPCWSQAVSEYFLHCQIKSPCLIIIVQHFYTSACFLSRDTTFYIKPCQLLVQRHLNLRQLGI